jgi:hypothetical protein
MGTFDVCVFVFTGLTTGMAIGLAIRDKKIKNLQNQIDYLEEDHNELIDKYTNSIIEVHKLKFENYLKATAPVKKDAVAKKKAGRPKGSTNKTKKDGGPTTGKYTRKSSK